MVLLVSFVSPESITEKLGNQNSYLIMFFIALLGGISVFSSIPYPLFLVTFALGGLNPYALALCTVLWVMMGDSVSYYFGRKWGKFLDGKFKHVLDKILHFYDTKGKYLWLIFFTYWTLSPFPNDIITFSAGLKKYSYWKMILPLSLGNFIFCLSLSYFAEYFSAFY